MSTLVKLRKARTLHDFADIVGYAPKTLSYIVYRLSNNQKYREFDIAKADGGTRKIRAPEPRLKLLQSRLSDLLYLSISDISKENPKFWRAVHGFSKDRSIITNAYRHRMKQYVFNVDIKDFFGSINFGRVRGYFIKDRHFQLNPDIATLIAQIACYDNSLPQGSPSSPVVSNLIGNLLDARLLLLARQNRCSYSRYADDLTFSTNEQKFPEAIGFEVSSGTWEAGAALHHEIASCGFSLNEEKTRIFHWKTRQTVTGLVVNRKVNVDRRYLHDIRAMCHSLFSNGHYRLGSKSDPTKNTRILEGKLSYVYYVKLKAGRPALGFRSNRAELKGPDKLYRDLLFYKFFVSHDAPLLVTEGPSDVAYIKAVIPKFAQTFPSLCETAAGQQKCKLSFFPTTGQTREILGMVGGTSGQCSLISSYSALLSKYRSRPLRQPVIILCDNDGAAKSVMKEAARIGGRPVDITTTDLFYRICYNLYFIKIPEGVPPAEKVIEDLFSPSLLSVELDGKKFDRAKDHGDHSNYAKVVFAEKVVKQKGQLVDLLAFKELLHRIDSCISDYRSNGPLG
jgi:retron-type reverse transcriptase